MIKRKYKFRDLFARPKDIGLQEPETANEKKLYIIGCFTAIVGALFVLSPLLIYSSLLGDYVTPWILTIPISIDRAAYLLLTLTPMFLWLIFCYKKAASFMCLSYNIASILYLDSETKDKTEAEIFGV